MINWTLIQKIKNTFANKLIGSMFWSIGGTLLSKIFMIITSILTARILGVDQNGEFGVINSTILMFSTFAGLSLGITATRFVAEYKKNDIEKCGRIITLTNTAGLVSGIIMALILFILSPFIAENMLNAPHLSLGLKLASIVLFTNTFNTIQSSTLAGFENFKGIAKLSIIKGIIALPIYITLTLIYQVEGLILGYIVIGIIMIILYSYENYKVAKRFNIKLSFKNIRNELGVLYKFSLPTLLSSIMVAPVVWIGNVFITNIPNGYSQLGIFNAAYQWHMVLILIPTAVGNVILPSIIQNNGKKSLEIINIILGWIIVVSFAIPIIIFPELFSWLYGDEFVGNTFDITLLIVVLTCCLLSFKEGISRNLVRNNLMWWGFLDNLLWGFIYLISLWFLRNYGAIGIAFSYLISYITAFFVFIPIYLKKGLVDYSLLASKEVIYLWGGLLIQITGSMFFDNIILRFVTLILIIYLLVKLINKMLLDVKIK